MASRIWRAKPKDASPAPVGEVRTSVTVSGDVSGQLAVGSHIVQMRVDTVHGNLVTVLPPDAKANVTPRPVPISLVPRRPAFLVGRQRETRLAVEALAGRRAVELYAPPGMGKSTLLRSLAHQLPITEACGGMAHLSARGLSHDDLLQVLFDVFYSSDIPVKPPRGELRHRLQHVRAALLLDDVELDEKDIEDVEDYAPECGFILTTGSDPGVSEALTIPLTGLRGSDARELVAHALGRPLGPEEQPAVDALCDLVQGAPAGLLRLAAAAREHDGSLAEFAATAAASGVPPLPVESAEDVRLLGLLAAVPGVNLDVRQLSELTGMADVQERVDRLVSQGLVLASAPPVSSGARVDYSLAPGVDLGPGGVWQMNQRRAELRDYFLRLSEERSETLLAPGAPPETLRALHSDAAKRREWRYVLALGVLLDAAYALSGRWDAWREVSETTLSAARAVGDPGAEAMALHQLGTRALCEGETSTAAQLLRSALDLRTAIGDVAAAQVTAHNLSLIAVPPPLPPEEQEESFVEDDESTFFADDSGAATVHSSGLDVGSSGATASGAHASGAHAVAGQGLSLGSALPIGASVLVVSAIVAGVVILRSGGSDAAEVALDPESLSFGTAPVNQVSETRTLTARNLGETSVHVDGFRTSGPNLSEFVIQGSNCRNRELEAGGTCSATVIFTPTGEGPRSASVAVDVRELPDDPGVQLSGSSAGPDPASPIAVPTELAFGEQPLNTSGQLRQVRLEGPLGGPVVLGPASVDGVDAADFLVEDNDCSGVQLTAGAECAIGVRFTPGGEGPRQGLLRLPSPDGIPGVAVPLSGTGATPEGTTAFEVRPRSVSFGQQPLNTPSEPEEVVVTNTGDAALRVSPMAVMGAPDFTISQAACPTTLAPGEDCAATVAFTPVATGPRTAQLLFGGGAGPAVPLSGNGAESRNDAPDVSPRLLRFGEQLVGGASPPQTVTLTNRADRPLRLSAGGITAATGSFRLDDAGCAAADVPPGQSCDLAVTFAPTVAGTHSGYLLLTAEGFPETAVVLGGVGVDPRTPPVPDVIRLPLADAQAELATAGFGTGAVERAAHPDIPSGSVSDQVPRGGTPLDQGGTVDLVVSTGPEPVTVPDVVGLTQSEAAERLADAGLRVGTITLQVHPSVPADDVISTDPVTGTEVPTGSPVGLTVSSGTERPRVPDVVGLSEEEAAYRIVEADLLVGTVSRTADSEVPEGEVISSDPVATTEVDPGSFVKLVISSGPPPVRVPDVVGMEESEARAVLERVPLTVGTVTPVPDCSIPDDEVISTAPSAGTEVERDSDVGLTVSTGEPRATVPDVTGLPESEAVARLQGSGFAATVVPQTDEERPKGQVIGTDPSAGGSASTCRPVYVTVSTGPAPVTVPEVAGSPEADARTAIEGKGLRVDPVTREASCQVANGIVIRSNPGGGTQVERGSAVGLVVSSGGRQAVVPDVSGRPKSEATVLLNGAGFEVGTVNLEASETVAEGSVIRSDPGAETTASTCSPVTLTVSSGSSKVTVPNVVGEDEETAVSALDGVGLEASISRRSDSSVPAGEVISTSPAAGERVERGNTVALVVSSGPPPAESESPPAESDPGPVLN